MTKKLTKKRVKWPVIAVWCPHVGHIRIGEAFKKCNQCVDVQVVPLEWIVEPSPGGYIGEALASCSPPAPKKGRKTKVKR